MAATGKSKVISSKSVTFVKGGNGHMFGKQTVAQQVPGQTSSMKGAGGGSSPSNWAKGGSTKMFGKQTVKPATPC